MQSSKLISGQSVVFQLKDAVCPDFSESVRAIGPELLVTGNIVFFSDGCDRKEQFAIIEVAGIHTPLIVSTECLKSVAGSATERLWRSAENPSREAC